MPAGHVGPDLPALEPIALRLRDWLAPTTWSVFTGRRTSGQQRGGAITPYVGTYFTNATALSQIDLMVARPDREVPLLVEVAERPLPPDRILGIAANILLADAIRYRDETYAIADSHLLLAVVAAPRGQARPRLAAIEDRLNWLATALARQGKPRLRGIRIAPAESVDGLAEVVLSEAQALVPLPRNPPSRQGEA